MVGWRAMFVVAVLIAGGTLAAAEPSAPCSDFVHVACAANPAAAPTIDKNDLAERNLATIRRIILGSTPADAADRALRALRDFHAACMDADAVAAAGREPVLPLLVKAGSVRNRDTFFRFVGEFHVIGIEPLFRLRVEIDPERPAQYAAVLYPAEPAFDDPAAYTGDSPAQRTLRDAFVAHVRRLFEILGQPATTAQLNAESVLAIEAALARAPSAAGERATAKAARRVPSAELDALTPGLSWQWYRQGSETEAVPEFLVVDPEYFRAMGETLSGLRIEALQSYLRWHILEHAAPLLAEFADEHGAFERLRGATPGSTLERAQRCVLETQAALPDLLDAPFASQFLTKEATRSASELAQAVRASLSGSIADAAWLDAASRAQLRQKLDGMELLVGAPDPPAKESLPAITRDAYARNTFLAFYRRFRQQIGQVGSAAERRAWQVPAAASTLHYDTPRNALTVPAGILQPPYFDPAAGLAFNYARLGAALGQEMILAIDRQAAKRIASDARALSCLEALRRPFTTANAAGEDWAALSAAVGGIRAAHDAWRRERARAGTSLKPEAAEEQEFFTEYALARCPADAGAGPATESARLRVLVPLAATEEFGRAFECRPGSPGRPKKSCAIW